MMIAIVGISALAHWRTVGLIESRSGLQQSRRYLQSFLPAGCAQLAQGSGRCFLTVAFVDLVGFTKTMEVLGDQVMSERLNDFFSEIHRRTSAQGGVVHKFIGDGALCVFPERANGNAAQACIHSLQALTHDYAVTVGVASGWCLMGAWGDAERQDFTVIGTPVNLASRL